MDYFNIKELIKSFFNINEPRFIIHVIDSNGSIVIWNTRISTKPSKCIPSTHVTIASFVLVEQQLIHLRENKDSTEIKVSIYNINKCNFWCKRENTLTNCYYFDIKYERQFKGTNC